MNSGEVKSEKIVTDNNGNASYEWTPTKEGFYQVKAEVKVAGRKQKTETEFSVFSDTEEFQKPIVNETLLKRIADITSGKYEVLTKNTDFSKIKFNDPKVEIKTHSRSVSLWDNWWVYGLISGCLFADWFTRRKLGLS